MAERKREMRVRITTPDGKMSEAHLFHKDGIVQFDQRYVGGSLADQEEFFDLMRDTVEGQIEDAKAAHCTVERLEGILGADIEKTPDVVN